MSVSQREPLTAEQQALVERYAPMAERIHGSFVRERRAAFYKEDLRAVAFSALHGCAANYDAASGTPFDVYAWKHIHGRLCRALRNEAKHWSAGRRAWDDAAEALEDPSDVMNDSDAVTTAHIDSLADDTAIAAVLGLSGEVLRAPGEGGAALRGTYGRTLAALDEALAQLDPRDRQLVELHDRDGLSWQEVTARTGVPVRSAKRYASQARRRLAALLRARGISGASI